MQKKTTQQHVIQLDPQTQFKFNIQVHIEL